MIQEYGPHWHVLKHNHDGIDMIHLGYQKIL